MTRPAAAPPPTGCSGTDACSRGVGRNSGSCGGRHWKIPAGRAHAHAAPCAAGDTGAPGPAIPARAGRKAARELRPGKGRGRTRGPRKNRRPRGWPSRGKTVRIPAWRDLLERLAEQEGPCPAGWRKEKGGKRHEESPGPLPADRSSPGKGCWPRSGSPAARPRWRPGTGWCGRAPCRWGSCPVPSGSCPGPRPGWRARRSPADIP